MGLLRWLRANWPPLRIWLPAVFVLAALPSGLLLAFIVPPGQVPDEQAHIARADSLTHGQLVGRHFTRTLEDGFSFQDSGVLVDLGLFTVAFAAPLDMIATGQAMSPALWHTMRTATWTFRPQLVEAQNVARYPPMFYLPAAAVLFVAKHAGGSPVQAILGGRAVNLLVFVALGALALSIAPRPLLLLPLAVPMTLGLAASFNPDALTIATIAVSIALISRLLDRGKTDWTIWLAAAGIGCVIAQRPPLLPIAALLLLPLEGGAWRDGRSTQVKLGATALAGGIGIAWFLFAEYAAGAPFVHSGLSDLGPLFKGPAGTVFRTTDGAAQLDILLHDPRQFLLLPARTLALEWRLKLREFIGVLGLLSLMLPRALYAAWGVAIGAAVLAEIPRLPGEWRGRPRDWALALLIMAGVVELIYVALYLTWTRVGADHVEGAQGRYFVALAAVALFAVPGMRPRPGLEKLGAAIRRTTLSGLAALCFVGSIVVPLAALQAYYLH